MSWLVCGDHLSTCVRTSYTAKYGVDQSCNLGSKSLLPASSEAKKLCFSIGKTLVFPIEAEAALEKKYTEWVSSVLTEPLEDLHRQSDDHNEWDSLLGATFPFPAEIITAPAAREYSPRQKRRDVSPLGRQVPTPKRRIQVIFPAQISKQVHKAREGDKRKITCRLEDLEVRIQHVSED